MAVPYTFGSATTSIPLSQLDSNFATAITLGNTAVQLGNTITTLTGVTNVASSGSLTLGTSGNTTAITVDTSQNVGIGTASPTSKLTVSSGATGTAASFSGSGTFSEISFKAGASTTAYIGVNNSDFLVETGGAESLRLNTNGALILKGGSASASGVGIAFPATQSTTSNANTLDDYEVGTFTPTLIDAGNNQPTSYTVQRGNYTKVGNAVTIEIYLNVTTLGGSITGAVAIGGLPFAAKNVSDLYAPFPVVYWGTMNTSFVWLGGFVNSTATKIGLYKATAAVTNVSAMQASDWKNASDMIIGGTYLT